MSIPEPSVIRVDHGIVFIVACFDLGIRNVILIAEGREEAKRMAQPILKGNPDGYIVDPITQRVSETVFLLVAR